jgi:hypothetical protein
MAWSVDLGGKVPLPIIFQRNFRTGARFLNKVSGEPGGSLPKVAALDLVVENRSSRATSLHSARLETPVCRRSEFSFFSRARRR